VAERFLDELPRPSEGHEAIYIAVIPHSLDDAGLYGHAHGWVVEREGRRRWIDGISLFHETISKTATLWVNAERIERATLIHEFGHLLGLVHNPAHTQKGNLGHCTSPKCVMTHPRWRSRVYWSTVGVLGKRMPTDFCHDCQADIVWAKGRWIAKARADPGYAGLLAKGERARRAVQMGQWLWLHDDSERALAVVEKALEEIPDDAQLLEFEGDLQRSRRNFPLALASYRRALAIKDGPGPRAGMALVHCARGSYARALASLDPASLELPTDLTTVRAASWALMGIGRAGEASRLWDRYVELTGRGRSAQLTHQHRVRLRRLAGRIQDAERLLRSSFQRWPWDRVLLEQAVRIELALGRQERARVRLQAMVASLDELERTNDGKLSAFLQATRLVYLALAGDEARVREGLGALDERTLRGEADGVSLLRKAEALVLIGERDAALDTLSALRGLPLPFSYEWDVCLDEDLMPLREDARFLVLFPRCGG